MNLFGFGNILCDHPGIIVHVLKAICLIEAISWSKQRTIYSSYFRIGCQIGGRCFSNISEFWVHYFLLLGYL